jgi:uncharacterized protein YkwD
MTTSHLFRSARRPLAALLALAACALPACGDKPDNAIDAETLFDGGLATAATDEGDSAAPAPGGETSALGSLDVEEAKFVDLINAYRAQNGLGALKVSIALTNAAEWMSTDMATRNYFSHTDSQGRNPFARMSDFGYPATGWRAENIAAGNSSALSTFNQWKNSAGHNANMLGAKYKVIGVGRAYNSAARYRWYWTTDFGSTVDATY